MNNKDNLQQAFEKAFEEHQEPLHQAQWDRLDAALDKKKSKFRLLPWFFSLAIIAMAALGVGYWLGSSKQKDLSQTKNTISVQKTETMTNNATPKAEEKEIQTEIAIPLTPLSRIKSGQAARGEQSPTKLESPQIALPSHIASPLTPLHGRGEQRPKQLESSLLISQNNDKKQNKEILNDKILSENIKENLNNLADKVETNKTNELIKDEKTDSTLFAKKAEDSTKNKKSKTSSPPPNKNSWFAIGFSTGISQAVYKNTIFSNPENMHKDTRKLYDENTKKTSSMFINLFFDCRIIRNVNLSLNSGVQYRTLKTEENVNYVLKELPFRNTDGSINQYLTDTSSNPLTFKNTSTKTNTYISIPLSANYIIPFRGKNEIQLSAGIIANKLVKATGSTFSINNGAIENYSDKLNKKLNFGYLFGIGYYRNIYKPLWAGFGYQAQQNQLQLNTDYGYIRSRINITNYTFNIKYKF